MSKRLFRPLTVALVASLLTLLVHSEQPDAWARAARRVPVVYSLTDAVLAKLVAALKLPHKRIGQGRFTVKMGGIMVLLTSSRTNLQLYTRFGARPHLGDVNKWNATRRFTRGYLDTGGEACLESDLDLAGGVTARTIWRWMKMFAQSAPAFGRQVVLKAKRRR